MVSLEKISFLNIRRIRREKKCTNFIWSHPMQDVICTAAKKERGQKVKHKILDNKYMSRKRYQVRFPKESIMHFSH